MSVARRIAVEIVAAFGPFGRRLGTEHVDEIATCIERHLGLFAEPEVLACTICTADSDGGPVIDLGDVKLCAPCYLHYQRALEEGGAVVRFRCKPALEGDAACGRVVRIGYTSLRPGPIVVDSDASCESCRSQRCARRELRRGA